jgi:hypothetical protein
VKTGFKICFFKFILYRYTEGARRALGAAAAAAAALRGEVGLYKLNSV